MSLFQRHIDLCNNARLPDGRVPLRLGDARVGWLAADLAAALRAFPELSGDGDGMQLQAPDALPRIARTLSDAGHFRWRDEAFDVRAEPDGPVLTTIDRGALPAFGIISVGAHVNGLVRTPGGLQIWVAMRSPHKQRDPSKLDNLVAGGVPAGMTADATLLKEAAEEASIPAALARMAVPVGRIRYTMQREEGLRRDLLHCYDLELSPDFVPRPGDDEVERFELWPIERALATVRDSDAFKFNVNLVLIDLFIRLGLIAGAEADELRAGLAGRHAA